MDCSFTFAEIGFPAGNFVVRNVWTGEEQSDNITSAASYVAKAVPHHGTALFRVSKANEDH